MPSFTYYVHSQSHEAGKISVLVPLLSSTLRCDEGSHRSTSIMAGIIMAYAAVAVSASPRQERSHFAVSLLITSALINAITGGRHATTDSSFQRTLPKISDNFQSQKINYAEFASSLPPWWSAFPSLPLLILLFPQFGPLQCYLPPSVCPLWAGSTRYKGEIAHQKITTTACYSYQSLCAFWAPPLSLKGSCYRLCRVLGQKSPNERTLDLLAWRAIKAAEASWAPTSSFVSGESVLESVSPQLPKIIGHKGGVVTVAPNGPAAGCQRGLLSSFPSLSFSRPGATTRGGQGGGD